MMGEAQGPQVSASAVAAILFKVSLCLNYLVIQEPHSDPVVGLGLYLDR